MMRAAVAEKQPEIFNVDLDGFLEALAAVFAAHRGILLPSENDCTIDVSTFGNMMAAALIAETLLELGADPLERMPHGGTLLHRLFQVTDAVRANFTAEVAMLDLLLEEDLDINARNDAGRTVLRLAAPDAVDAAAIRLLLDRGADRTLRDADGKRALDLVPRLKKDLRAALATKR